MELGCTPNKETWSLYEEYFTRNPNDTVLVHFLTKFNIIQWCIENIYDSDTLGLTTHLNRTYHKKDSGRLKISLSIHNPNGYFRIWEFKMHVMGVKYTI